MTKVFRMKTLDGKLKRGKKKIPKQNLGRSENSVLKNKKSSKHLTHNLVMRLLYIDLLDYI